MLTISGLPAVWTGRDDVCDALAKRTRLGEGENREPIVGLTAKEIW